MFKLLIVALFATATATSAWKYMSPDHACVDNTLRLTCTFPRMTSYDKAFTMAAYKAQRTPAGGWAFPPL
jgi:hypothetical protein